MTPTFNVDSISARAQAARSLVCLLVVFVHVIGNAINAGIQIDNNSAYYFVADFFAPIRMPLFACLSGFVYAYRPFHRDQWRNFAAKKILRLGVPLFVASTVTFFSLVIIGRQVDVYFGVDANPDLWSLARAYYYPFQHLWFLQALLGVIAVVMALELLPTMISLKRWLVMFALSLIAFATSPLNSLIVFSIKDISFLLPFFLLGLAANRFGKQVLAPKTMQTVAVIFVAAAAMQAVDASFGHGDFERTAPLATVFGLSAVLCILRWMPTAKPFLWIGGYSFSIYLYHTIVIALAAFVATKFGLHSAPIFVAATLVFSVMLPIALEAATRKNATARLLLLGEYRKSKAAARPQSQIEFA